MSASEPAKGRGTPVVTVIVPMYNERVYILECLSSLIGQDYPRVGLEILVVDGMSDDGSRAIVRGFIDEHPEWTIRMLDNPRRIPAAALNTGIQEARGEVITCLDGHGFVASGFVSASVGHLYQGEADCVVASMCWVTACLV